MKKAPPPATRRRPVRKRVGPKASANGDVIARLVARHELTELEANWLLKAWKLGNVAKSRNRFACYLAGFMAGTALKIVEQEVGSARN
jgi:hypothetical protein